MKRKTRDARIIGLRNSGRTLKEIGDRYGISPARVGAIIYNAERKARRFYYNPPLDLSLAINAIQLRKWGMADEEIPYRLGAWPGDIQRAIENLNDGDVARVELAVLVRFLCAGGFDHLLPTSLGPGGCAVV